MGTSTTSARPWTWSTGSRRWRGGQADLATALLADKGYDSYRLRRELARRRIVPIISSRGITGVPGLGTLRSLVEQTLALLHQFTRPAVRWEHHLDLHEALISLACALICGRRLKNQRSRSC